MFSLSRIAMSFSFLHFRRSLLLLLLLCGGCAEVPRDRFGDDINRLLASGHRYAAALAARPAEQLLDEEVIALGYLERARLGLGSPFRLIAYTTRDRRLAPQEREVLGYAILDLVLAERSYAVDPVVLNGIRLAGVLPQLPLGHRHLELIERTVREAPTARAGERAVRVGYALAEAERTITSGGAQTVAFVAAMAADRRRAGEDTRALLEAAALQGKDPLLLLEEWRREHRFGVEQPTLSPSTPAEQAAEASIAPRVARVLRLSAQRFGASASLIPERRSATSAHPSWLSPRAAERLLELAAAQDYPPQAPIAIAVLIHRPFLLSAPAPAGWQRELRKEFAAAAKNEEMLVAAAALLRRVDEQGQTPLAALQLGSAVFFRAWNQEEPWLPGDGGPTVRDLQARYGVAEVGWDPELPRSWQPFYRTMLDRSLGDLQRVLPAISLRGLTIHIGELAEDSIPPFRLALHEPRRRRIILPPATGAGTIAHEIAHDLDWQLARRRYARRGGYATDLAVLRGKGDRIASSVAMLANGAASEMDGGESRPTELFARRTDWFVAMALARQGRSGGALTSFQEPAIRGYGSAAALDVERSAISALLALLDEIAPPSPETREWLASLQSPMQSLTAEETVDVLRFVGRGRAPSERLALLSRTRDRVLAALLPTVCPTPLEAAQRRGVVARRELVHAATEAVARGIVVDGIRDLIRRVQPNISEAELEEWLRWRIYGGPEPLDPLLRGIAPFAEPLITRAEEISRARDASPPEDFLRPVGPTLCAGNPFASDGEFNPSDLRTGVPIAPPFGTR